jgi:response regulator NasT
MSSMSLSILVIDENVSRASLIEAALQKEGHERVFIANTIDGVGRLISDVDPDVIVIDLDNPNRDMLENLFQLTRSVQRPIAMFVDRSDKAATEAAIDAGVSAYVVDGLRPERIKPIIDMAVSRFNAYTRMTKEIDQARGELAARKVIERAKGILMKARRIDEDAAYTILRKTAMSQNRKIIDVAEGLIVAADIMGEKSDE